MDCAVCAKCPKEDGSNPLAAFTQGVPCATKCNLCGFCGTSQALSSFFGNLGGGGGFGGFGGLGGGSGGFNQCEFCKPGADDPSGSKACTAACIEGETICGTQGFCQTQCSN